jgi:hypothetical protein
VNIGGGAELLICAGSIGTTSSADALSGVHENGIFFHGIIPSLPKA